MKRLCGVFVVLIVLLCGVVDAYEDASYIYTFPISSKASGQAGTFWMTELCLFNPWSATKRIIVGVFQNGEVLSARWADVGAKNTACWPDIYAALGLSNGRGFLVALNELEYEFNASMRIYNTASTGTYGQTVAPTHGTEGWPFPGQLLVIPGVHHYGTPGGSGARTNIGIANISEDPGVATVKACSENGSCSYTTFDLPGWTVIQNPVFRTFENGTITVQATQVVLAYASVVDNKSGDAVFKPHQLDSYSAKSVVDKAMLDGLGQKLLSTATEELQ